MSKLIRNVTLVYPGHQFSGKKIDLLVDNGHIKSLGTSISDRAGEVIEAEGFFLFPALVDAQCAVGEPGHEPRETRASLAAAAAAGGFAHVALLPTTQPVADSRAAVEAVISASRNLPAVLHPMAALSKGCLGTELSEMADLKHAGAVGFSDGKKTVSASLLKLALEYAKPLNAPVHSHPHLDELVPGAVANESEATIALGLKSVPALAEELQVMRDLKLAEYTGGWIHLSTISTEASAVLVREAKAKGVKVTCAVPLANLLWHDGQLSTFDSNFKFKPPLRHQREREGLLKALADGTIDCIITDHTPELVDAKLLEFDMAAFGSVMIESALSLMNEHLVNQLGWDIVVQAFSLRPRKLLGLAAPELAVGAPFEFTLFNPIERWVYDNKTAHSLSSNSPVFGTSLRGKVVV